MNATTTLAARALRLGIAALLASPAHAAGREAPTVDQKTSIKLNKAIEHLNAEKYDEARAILEGLLEKKLSPYERARVENIFAAVAQTQARYGEAREHLRRSIESGGLNEQEISSARFQVAQLFLAEERWKDGLEALKAWFASGATPNSSAYYLLAIAYYQLKQFDAALEPAQKAIDFSEKPQESWLHLLVSLRLERQEFALALPILRRLVGIAPGKKLYWMQLSSVYAVMEKYPEALVPMQLAYYAGLLTDESEYRRLADLLVHVSIPHRAALMLTQAIEQKQVPGDVKDWEKLGNAWIAARHYDKAVAPMTRAAGMAEDGNLYVRLAELQIQLEEWPKAVEALSHALGKGNLKNPGGVQLLMGIALFNQKKLKEARAYFQRAAQDDKNRSQAEGWLRYVDVEMRG